MNRYYTTRVLAIAVAVGVGMMGGRAQAANLTWDSTAGAPLNDGGGAWLGAGQWYNGAVPSATWTSGDDAIFGAGGAGGAVTLGVGGTTVNSLTLNFFSGTYTLGTAGNTMTLNNGITANPAAGAVSIISPVTLGGAQTWVNNYLLTVGTANIVNGGFLLTVGGSGNTTISGVLGSGAGGLTKNGLGTLTLSAANTYTGTTTANAGTLTLSGSGTINTTTAVALNGGNINFVNTAQVNRLADGAAITSTGGTITYNNTSGANTYTETIGAVTLSSGQLDVVEAVNQAGAGSQTLTLSNPLTQSNQGVVTFSAATTAPNATKNMIKVSGMTGPGAGQNLPGGLIIGPWATAGTTAALQTDYAVYDGTGNVLPANITAAANDANWTTSTRAYTLSGATILTADRTITALRYSGATATLTLASGWNLKTLGVFFGGTAANTLTIATGTGGVLTTPAGVNNLFLTTGNGGITVSAPINDNGGALTLVKSGTGGTLTLSGSNGYTGGTVLNAGILVANTTASLPGYNSAGKVVFNGGTLQLPSAWAMADINTLVSNATKNSGALAIDTTSGSQTQTAAWNLGTVGLTKVGTGTLTLNQANTYTGRTTVNAGTLQLSHANALGSSELYLAGSATVLDTTVNLTALRFGSGVSTVSGGTLNFAPGGTIRVTDNTLNQTIQSAITGSPAVRVAGLAANYEGLIFAPNIGTQTLGVMYYPDITLPGTADKPGIHLAGTTTGNSVASVINPQGNYGALYKDGSGTWTVGNVVIGPIRINGGTLVANGTLQSVYQGINVYSGAALHYNNAGAVNGSFGLNGGSFLDNSSGAAITTSTYNPTMGWNGDFTFIGSNGADSDLYLGAGKVTINGTAGQRIVTVQNAETTVSVGGQIVGTGYGVTKAGDGTLALSGDNAYTGPTVVNAGTLLVNSPGSLNAASAVTVNANGTLGGTGIINGAVAVSGTLAPGASAGTLTVNSSLSMETGSTYVWQLGSGDLADLVDVNGTLSIASSWTLKLMSDGGTPGAGEYNLFTYDAFSGSFTLPTIDPTGTWKTAKVAQDTVGKRIYLSFGLPGDANGDFVVDAADYIAVKTNFGMTTGATLAMGDFDSDGKVDWDDLQVLMANFGTRSIGGAPAIPEPATLGLLAIGALAVIRRRRK